MRFVLVHGGFHGAWCWQRTIPEIERLGHQAIAIDVPGHGERAAEEATMQGRLDAVTSVLEPGDVLVGHSGGGFEITRAADTRPDLVSHLVYLAAALPVEGRTMGESIAYHEEVRRARQSSRAEAAVFDLFNEYTPLIYSKSGHWATFVHAVTHDESAVRQRGGFETLAICDASRAFAPSQDRDLAGRRRLSRSIVQ